MLNYLYKSPTNLNKKHLYIQSVSVDYRLIGADNYFSGEDYLVGDFTIHFGLLSNSQTSQFLDILDTHCSGNTLDVLITKRINSDSIISLNILYLMLQCTILILSVIYAFLLSKDLKFISYK